MMATLKKLFIFFTFSFLCITTMLSQQVTYDWKHVIPGNAYTTLCCMATDSSGNMYVGGRLDSTVTFVDTTINNTDITGFLAKFTPDGDMVWFKQFQYSQCVYSICFDSEDDLYISGSYNGKVQINDTLLYTHNIDTIFFGMFIAKFNTDGNRIWAKTTCGTFYYESGYGKLKQMTIDKDDNLVIVGFGLDDLEYFDTTGTYNPIDSVWVTSPWPPHWEYHNYYSNYMVKYNKDGQKLWIRDLGGYNQHYLAIATDYSNNILLTGYFWNDTPFVVDSITLNSSGEENIFIIKYKPNGQLLWAQRGGGVCNGNKAYDVVSDEYNNVYLAGVASGNAVEFGGNTYGGFLKHLFIVKYSETGVVEWLRHYGNGELISSYDYILSIHYNNNEIITSGFFYDSLHLGYDFLNSYISSWYASGIFIRFDNNGNLIDAAMDHENVQCTPIYFFIGNDNNFYVAGNYISLGGIEDCIFLGRFPYSFLLNNPYIKLSRGNVVIFPNPCSENFTILSDFDQQSTIEIVDISGKPVLFQTIHDNLNTINISAFSKGVYFVKVGNQVSKLIVN